MDREQIQFVYRTTKTVRCEACGAEPGESCHLEPGRETMVRERFHTCRIDPNSEPIGKLSPPDPRYPVQVIEPL